MQKEYYINASELGDYVYCKRGWWLRCNGIMTGSNNDMIRGTNAHIRLSQALDLNRKKTNIAWIIIILAIGLLMLLLSIFLMTNMRQ